MTLTRDSPGINGAPQAGEGWGSVLAASALGGGDRADLAIGVPARDLGSVIDAGQVHVPYGSAQNGLSGNDDQTWTQNSPGIADTAERRDRFGQVLR